MAQPQQGGDWNSGLFSCFSDCGSCFYTWCCLPCSYGSNVATLPSDSGAMGAGSCFAGCCIYCLSSYCYLCCIPHSSTRQAIKRKYGITKQENDCLITCCCSPCAVCQEARQIKHGAAQFGALPAAVPAAPK